MHRPYSPMKQAFLLCVLMTSCWCLCSAPAASDWSLALFQLAIGFVSFYCLEFATKDDGEVLDMVHKILLFCICFMCMYSCFLVGARVRTWIVSGFAQIWKKPDVREVRGNVCSLCHLMQDGTWGPIVFFVVLVVYMQRPCTCGVC
jgi:hypothetical protein